MRFGAGEQPADYPGVGLSQGVVNVAPGPSGGGAEVNLAFAPGVLEVGAELVDQAGPGRGVGVASFGQQPGPPCGDEDEAVEQTVGDLEAVGVMQ